MGLLALEFGNATQESNVGTLRVWVDAAAMSKLSLAWSGPMKRRGVAVVRAKKSGKKQSQQKNARFARPKPAQRAAQKVKAKKVSVPSKQLVAKKNVEPKVKLSKQEQYEKLIIEHRENGRKLARSLLRRWRVRLPAEEIDSIVDLTLCEAAGRYSTAHGASFMTFLFYHLRGNLVRCIQTAAKSSSLVVAFARNAGIDVSEWSTSQDPTMAAKVPEFALLENRENDLPEQLLLRRERIQLCRDACTHLDELEREIVLRSYSNDEALIDIAKSLGYSRCHVSRVKKRALDRLKSILDGSPLVETADTESEEGTLSSQITVEQIKSERRRSRRKPIIRQQAVATEDTVIEADYPKAEAA